MHSVHDDALVELPGDEELFQVPGQFEAVDEAGLGDVGFRDAHLLLVDLLQWVAFVC